MQHTTLYSPGGPLCICSAGCISSCYGRDRLAHPDEWAVMSEIERELHALRHRPSTDPTAFRAWTADREAPYLARADIAAAAWMANNLAPEQRVAAEQAARPAALAALRSFLGAKCGLDGDKTVEQYGTSAYYTDCMVRAAGIKP